MRIIPLLLILLLCSVATQSYARMYRWVDDNGITVYSQIPPGDRKAREIAPPPPPSTPVQKAPETKSKNTSSTKAKKAPTANPQRQQENAAITKRNCEIARSNLKLYQTPGNHRYKAKDGSYQYLSQEVKEEKIAIAEKQIQTFCAE